jgi:hypothetical protein
MIMVMEARIFIAQLRLRVITIHQRNLIVHLNPIQLSNNQKHIFNSILLLFSAFLFFGSSASNNLMITLRGTCLSTKEWSPVTFYQAFQ